jgi:hypothetical protein
MALQKAVNKISVHYGISDSLTHKIGPCNVASEAPQRKPQVESCINPLQKNPYGK